MKRFILFMAIALSYHAYTQPPKDCPTIIKGTAGFLRDGDTVILEVVKYGYFHGIKGFNESFSSVVKNSSYTFSVSIYIPSYINLILSAKNQNHNLYSYLIEPGAIISAKAVGIDSFQFSGKDGRKIQIQYEKRKIQLRGLHDVSNWSPLHIIQTFATLDFFSLKQIEYLMAKKKELGRRLYTLLLADVLGESGLKIDNFLPYNSPTDVDIWRAALINYKDKVWSNYNSFANDEEQLQYSITYANALIAKYKWDSCIVINRKFKVKECYEYFTNKYKGSLREKIITVLLNDSKDEPEDFSSCLNSSLRFVKNRDFKGILAILSNVIKGASAYNFNLSDTSGVEHSLSEYGGKVVLLDFWFTGCYGCAELKPKMDSIISLYKSGQILFISISTDESKNQWIQSVRKGRYTSGQSINLFTNGSGNSHPIISHYAIASYPRLILINKRGLLCNNPIDPRFDNGISLIKLLNESLQD
jgi:thiol-disulfide isomerase/thioredoxin